MESHDLKGFEAVLEKQRTVRIKSLDGLRRAAGITGIMHGTSKAGALPSNQHRVMFRAWVHGHADTSTFVFFDSGFQAIKHLLALRPDGDATEVCVLTGCLRSAHAHAVAIALAHRMFGEKLLKQYFVMLASCAGRLKQDRLVHGAFMADVFRDEAACGAMWSCDSLSKHFFTRAMCVASRDLSADDKSMFVVGHMALTARGNEYVRMPSWFGTSDVLRDVLTNPQISEGEFASCPGADVVLYRAAMQLAAILTNEFGHYDIRSGISLGELTNVVPYWPNVVVLLNHRVVGIRAAAAVYVATCTARKPRNAHDIAWAVFGRHKDAHDTTSRPLEVELPWIRTGSPTVILLVNVTPLWAWLVEGDLADRQSTTRAALIMANCFAMRKWEPFVQMMEVLEATLRPFMAIRTLKRMGRFMREVESVRRLAVTRGTIGMLSMKRANVLSPVHSVYTLAQWRGTVLRCGGGGGGLPRVDHAGELRVTNLSAFGAHPGESEIYALAKDAELESADHLAELVNKVGPRGLLVDLNLISTAGGYVPDNLVHAGFVDTVADIPGVSRLAFAPPKTNNADPDIAVAGFYILVGADNVGDAGVPANETVIHDWLDGMSNLSSIAAMLVYKRVEFSGKTQIRRSLHRPLQIITESLTAVRLFTGDCWTHGMVVSVVTKMLLGRGGSNHLRTGCKQCVRALYTLVHATPTVAARRLPVDNAGREAAVRVAVGMERLVDRPGAVLCRTDLVDAIRDAMFGVDPPHVVVVPPGLNDAPRPPHAQRFCLDHADELFARMTQTEHAVEERKFNMRTFGLYEEPRFGVSVISLHVALSLCEQNLHAAARVCPDLVKFIGEIYVLQSVCNVDAHAISQWPAAAQLRYARMLFNRIILHVDDSVTALLANRTQARDDERAAAQLSLEGGDAGATEELLAEGGGVTDGAITAVPAAYEQTIGIPPGTDTIDQVSDGAEPEEHDTDCDVFGECEQCCDLGECTTKDGRADMSLDSTPGGGIKCIFCQ